MKKIIFILTCFLWLNANAQNEPLIFKVRFFTTDQTGSYYEITSNQIFKTGKNGQRQFTYSNNILGEISSVDVSNPMKIIVFFKEFSKVVVLDNTLTEQGGVLDLNEVSLEETSLVCSSYNNGVWYYNPIKYQLTRIENTTNITNTSANISTLLNINIQPNFLVEFNNKVYLNDPTNGILVFDIYGTYIKTIPIFGLTSFQVKEKYLLYVNQQGNIETYDFFTLEKTVYKPLQYSNIKMVRIENKTIYIINSKNELIQDTIEL
ncbi:MAG TPA: hypothetical protein PK833_04765 [Vicingus sp.]|nr:hypothetical protein [Vicingus sp.]